MYSTKQTTVLSFHLPEKATTFSPVIKNDVQCFASHHNLAPDDGFSIMNYIFHEWHVLHQMNQ
jgi:hypothetical protein